MSAVFYIKAKCHGCGFVSEHVVNRETYSAKCPNCPQFISINHNNGAIVLSACPVCGIAYDDYHRWEGNYAVCLKGVKS